MRGAAKTKPATGPTTIDEYLARLDDDQRAALQRVREIVRKVAPKAEECISYQLPAFRVDGRCVLWFGAAARHCALYGVHDQELHGYATSGRGTLRFTPDAPLPATLVRKLVKARIAQNAARLAASKARARTRVETKRKS
jgi:uncharacterized protein YdhG (YjbR/CyaY superfamily)